MTKNIPLSLALLCITVIVQVFGVSHLALFTVSPDAVTIFLAFIAVIIGQKAGMSFGFLAGTITGLFSGNLGLHMLARTVEGFIAGFFHIPEQSHATARQKIKRTYSAIVTAGFLANAISAAGYNPLGLSPLYRIVVLGALESLFTLILAIIANWLFLRKSLSD